MVLDPLGVDADIPFHEMEARAIKETADGIGANVEAINFVVIVFQQTLGQVVTNKTVHAEDQHAGAALNCHHRGAGDQGAGNQPQRLRQLRALHINAVVGLTGHDLQRLLAAANNQRRDRDDSARFRGRDIVAHAGFPDDEFADAGKAIRPRPGVGHRAYQAGLFQSRRPSSGVRRPKQLALLSS